MNQALIFTTRGNLPISDLTHEVEWRVGADQVIFIERYKLDGDVVKESTHVKLLTGAAALGEAAI